MTHEGFRPESPSRKALTWQLVGTFIVAGVVTVLVVLPAEYRYDPTGFGALTGLDRISGPQEVVVETRIDAPPEILQMTEIPFRRDTITIEVPEMARGLSTAWLEYKVTMNEGDTLMYSWVASHDVEFEFHGHRELDDGDIEVMNYHIDVASEGHGVLRAPLTGEHGWYFANSDFDNFDNPITIELELSGNYLLEPGFLLP